MCWILTEGRRRSWLSTTSSVQWLLYFSPVRYCAYLVIQSASRRDPTESADPSGHTDLRSAFFLKSSSFFLPSKGNSMSNKHKTLLTPSSSHLRYPISNEKQCYAALENGNVFFCQRWWLQYNDHPPPTSLLLGCKIRVPQERKCAFHERLTYLQIPISDAVNGHQKKSE